MYGLRKISKDGKNDFNDFVWPLEVGAEVEAPDWNSKPECGGGLYCLPNASGDWGLLWGELWAVLEFDERDMVLIEDDKCKVKKCKIVFLSENPSEEMLQFFDHENFDSDIAYLWAYFVGNKDVMIDKIVESECAYNWAYHIGNQDIMIDRITEPRWAYRWAYKIGNKDIMISKIVESRWAYYWARDIGNRDIMIDRITESEWAYNWVSLFGNEDIMIDRITESKWAYFWAKKIGNRDTIIERFPEIATRLK